MAHKIVSPKLYVMNFFILGFLMALTVIAAKAPFFHISDNPNGANLAVALLIAAAKATFIALIFMGVRWSSPLVKVLSLTSVAFLGIFFLFTFTDYLNPHDEFGSPYHDRELPGANPLPGGQGFALQGFEEAPASGGDYTPPPHLFGHGGEGDHGADTGHGEGSGAGHDEGAGSGSGH